jgi:hypothetical protein
MDQRDVMAKYKSVRTSRSNHVLVIGGVSEYQTKKAQPARGLRPADANFHGIDFKSKTSPGIGS